MVAFEPIGCGLSSYGLNGAKKRRSTDNMAFFTFSVLITPWSFHFVVVVELNKMLNQEMNERKK